jgi:PhzF family phenazine biosynthesis protein
MRLKQFTIDAFAEKAFSGNPAAVCLLDEWISDELMQNIAAENNLAETAFVVKNGTDFHIRWFTPTIEVDLCGHATLATAHVIFNYTGYKKPEISFNSRSGILKTSKEADLLVLNFPADKISPSSLAPEVIQALSHHLPVSIFRGVSDFMVVYRDQDQVEQMKPEFAVIAKVAARGIIVTAPGRDCDFISRFFAPQTGIDEDPATGSAHTTLVPYWSKQLRKKELRAKQLSKRGGDLYCTELGERVEIAGRAITYLQGEIEINA